MIYVTRVREAVREFCCGVSERHADTHHRKGIGLPQFGRPHKGAARYFALSERTPRLGARPVYEPQVLVGARQFARDTGLGLSFPAVGKSMHVFDGNMCIATAETDDSAL
jgi:hypothetical protein